MQGNYKSYSNLVSFKKSIFIVPKIHRIINYSIASLNRFDIINININGVSTSF